MPRADANVQRTSRSASVWGGAKTEGDVRSSAFTGSMPAWASLSELRNLEVPMLQVEDMPMFEM